jgi:predicted DCC family thiol-disulfide oxidoreductase YuxK
MLERLDPKGRLRFVDIHDPSGAARDFPELRWEDLMDEMHVVDPDGRVTRGFIAFRTIAGVLPSLWALKPVLNLPGVSRLGRRVYRWVAKLRARGCPDGTCSLHGGPPSERPGA